MKQLNFEHARTRNLTYSTRIVLYIVYLGSKLSYDEFMYLSRCLSNVISCVNGPLSLHTCIYMRIEVNERRIRVYLGTLFLFLDCTTYHHVGSLVITKERTRDKIEINC